MPESIEEYAARVAAAAGDDGRLAIDPDGVVGWDIFPFEPDGLRLKPAPTLVDGPEPPRGGEDPETCLCRRTDAEDPAGFSTFWEDEDWVVRAAPPSGAPLVLAVQTRRHMDVPDLDDGLAAGFGRLHVALVSAVEALPSVGRCHSFRIGDGGAHAHWWFIARPARMPLLRGSFMVDWDDFLPPVPLQVRDDNAAFVAERLRQRLGGRTPRAAG